MHRLPPLTLVLGGARSGKSAHAEQLVISAPAPWLYLATGQAFDDEMRERIAEHRKRRDSRWLTIDAPVELAAALRAQAGQRRAVLVDCLTLWLSNTMLAGHDVGVAVDDLVDALRHAQGPIVAVSNEVGLGIVPETALGRSFRDAQGALNQRVAAVADDVFFVAAGLPLTLKSGETPR